MSRLLLRVLTACSAEMPQAASVGSRTPSRTPKPHQALVLASRSRFNWRPRSSSDSYKNPYPKKAPDQIGGLLLFARPRQSEGVAPPLPPVPQTSAHPLQRYIHC